MARWQVTIGKSFSTSVEVEADSIEEAKALAYENEPGDSMVGFDWEPDGESQVYAVYDENRDQIWSAFTSKDKS